MDVILLDSCDIFLILRFLLLASLRVDERDLAVPV